MVEKDIIKSPDMELAKGIFDLTGIELKTSKEFSVFFNRDIDDHLSDKEIGELVEKISIDV